MIRKPKKTSKTTVDNRTYKSSKKEMLGLCQICKIHRGCNGTRRWVKFPNWKSLRKTQWKN